MRAGPWLLLALLSVILPARVAAQGAYSINCIPPPEAEGRLRDGSYEGTFKVKLTFQQNLGGSLMTQTLQGEGDFKLKLDRFGKPGSKTVGASDASRLQGTISTSTTMGWGLPVAGQAAQQLQGMGNLELEGKPDLNWFEAVSHHWVAGKLNVQAPGWNSSRDQYFNEEIKLQFLANQGDCHGAQGQVNSPALEDMERRMREAGFTVQRGDCTWSMTRVEDLADPIRWLKEELAKGGPGGAADRKAEAKRMSAIAEQIKQYPRDIIGCLSPIWREHVTKLHWEWVEQDAANLRAYQGEWPGLADLTARGLDTTRAISLIGIDTCARAAQELIWNALSSSFSRQLKRMVEGGASLARMLDAIRLAELYGVVSPPLREQCQAAVQQLARQEADAAYQALLAAYAGAGQQVQAPEVQRALAKAKRAEDVAALHDVPTTQTATWEATHPQPPPQPGAPK